MENLTKAAVLGFCDFSVAKGLINRNSGGALKSAVARILEDYAPDADLSGIDVPSEVIRYRNRHPNDLSPESLQSYQRRVQQALTEFAKYQSSPTTYKGLGRAITGGNGKPPEKRKPQPSDVVIDVPTGHAGTHGSAPKAATGTVTDTSLVMPFPLRPTFMAQVILPHDLTKAEATRLSTFIMALAHEN